MITIDQQKGVEVTFLQTDSQSSYNTVCNFPDGFPCVIATAFSTLAFSAPQTSCATRQKLSDLRSRTGNFVAQQSWARKLLNYVACLTLALGMLFRCGTHWVIYSTLEGYHWWHR